MLNAELRQKFIVAKSKPTVRYVLVGGTTFCIEIIVIIIAQSLNQNNVTSVAISFWVGLVVSFLLQKIFTFKNTRKESHVVFRQAMLFSLLVAFNFFFTICVTKLLQNLIPIWLVRGIAIGLTTIWNYYLYKTSIFKSTPIS